MGVSISRYHELDHMHECFKQWWVLVVGAPPHPSIPKNWAVWKLVARRKAWRSGLPAIDGSGISPYRRLARGLRDMRMNTHEGPWHITDPLCCEVAWSATSQHRATVMCTDISVLWCYKLRQNEDRAIRHTVTALTVMTRAHTKQERELQK